jgi:lysozyme
MEIKQMDAAGIDFLIGNEGLILKPYLDSVGIPTIGVGCTYHSDGRRVRMTDKALTRDEAITLFRTVLKNYEMAVYSTTRDDINQNQFNALVSLCFNIGVSAYKKSTLLKRVNSNAPDKDVVSAFMMWRFPSEIIGRRKREVELYFKK